MLFLILGSSLVQLLITDYLRIRPPVYYHLIQTYPIPTESWFISLTSTSLLCVSFNAIIFVEIMKKLIDKYLIKNAGNQPYKHSFFNSLNVSIVCLLVLEVCNLTAFGQFLLLKEEIKPRDKTFVAASFIFYLFCEGCLAPSIIIFSNENLMQYLYTKYVKRLNFKPDECSVVELTSIATNKVCPTPFIVCKE